MPPPHNCARLAKFYFFGISVLVRAPLIRREWMKNHQVMEMLAPPPRYALRIRRTTFCLHRGRAVSRDAAANRWTTWVYRVQRMNLVEGTLTVRALGIGYGWHFTAVTQPWPGRAGTLIRDAMPVMGISRMG